MNRWIGMGRITRDLEMKYSKDGMAILKFSIAINRMKKGETDFINCLAFKEKAENISKFFKKGKMIAIEGRIQTGSYDKDGQKVYTTEILIDAFHFTGEKKDDTEQATNEGFTQAEIDNGEDTLPF